MGSTTDPLQHPTPASSIADLLGILGRGVLPNEADVERWPWCFTQDLTKAQHGLLSAWVDGASPGATAQQKYRLNVMLDLCRATSRPAEISQGVAAFKDVLARSAAHAHYADKSRHFPFPLTDEKAASLLYLTAACAVVRKGILYTADDVHRLVSFAPHLGAVVDALESDRLIGAGDAGRMRAALPRVQAAVALTREFASALPSQLAFMAGTLQLSPQSLLPGAQQPWRVIDGLFARLAQWTHYKSYDAFEKQGHLDRQLSLIGRAEAVGLINNEQKEGLLSQFAYSLEDARDPSGSVENFLGSKPQWPSRIPVCVELPAHVVQRLQKAFGFTQERLDQLSDDILACLNAPRDAASVIAFDRKYWPCLKGSIGSSAVASALNKLALEIKSPATPSPVESLVAAFHTQMAHYPGEGETHDTNRHYQLPLSSHVDAAGLTYQSMVNAVRGYGMLAGAEDVVKLEALAPHLEALVKALEQANVIDRSSAAMMRQEIPRVRAAVGLMGEFAARGSLNVRFVERTLAVPFLSHHRDPEFMSDLLDELAKTMQTWSNHWPAHVYAATLAADHARLLDRAAEVGLLSAAQRDWISRRLRVHQARQEMLDSRH